MLKRVSIQNFKSLKDVTLDLQKVNLLIGPNNSGKTNFLKALEFAGDWNGGKITGNLSFRDLVFKRSEYEQGFKVELSIYQENNKDEYVYSIKTHISQISGSADGFTESMQEFLIDSVEKNRLELDFHPYFGATLNGDKLNNQQIVPGVFLHISSRAYEAGAQSIITHLEYLRIYKPDPNKLTKPGPIGINAEIVAADASNIVGFLDLMLGKYRKTVFGRIETDISTCLSEFDEIKIDDAPLTEELKKQFGEKAFKQIGLANGNQNITYWADELSEGTLYFIALLCIINQPNPPKLLLLEEPEKGIHPRRIREVMDFIFRLAEEKDVQIILTTHNEHVLDDFATRPEAVFVFDKDEEGATYVRNLQKDIIEPTNQRNRELGLDEIDLTTNLSENWLYGLLGGVPAIP